MSTAYIYGIFNTKNDKVYVGCTKNFNRRKHNHLLGIRNGNYHLFQQNLYEFLQDVGKENIFFKILEIIRYDTIFERCEREWYWISAYGKRTLNTYKGDSIYYQNNHTKINKRARDYYRYKTEARRLRNIKVSPFRSRSSSTRFVMGCDGKTKMKRTPTSLHSNSFVLFEPL